MLKFQLMNDPFCPLSAQAQWIYLLLKQNVNFQNFALNRFFFFAPNLSSVESIESMIYWERIQGVWEPLPTEMLENKNIDPL